MAKRETYTKEFKQEAVKLLEKGDKPAIELARELGIRRNLLYKWQEQLRTKGTAAFSGPGRPASDSSKDAEIARLKQELEQVKEERDILKKAAAYFAKDVR
jgi:transposase